MRKTLSQAEGKNATLASASELATEKQNEEICAATSENVPLDMCAQRRFRSACSFEQSDQNLHKAHSE